MSAVMDTIMVIAKEPEPGRAKTRLTPPLTPRQAAEVAAACLADTLDEVRRWPARRHVLVLDGARIFDVPGEFEIWPQADGGLDERLAAAFERSAAPSLLVGMDTPQLRREDVEATLRPDAWSQHDCWLGPAADGGYWALALADPDPTLLRGVPMSTAGTCDAQCARLESAGLRVGLLRELRDVDTARDATAVAAMCTSRRFGQTWLRIGVPDAAA